MVSPIKRSNSKSKNLANAAKETDTEKCDHNFSITGYVAEVREKDFRKCWPFSEKSASLAEKRIYSLPLPVPKFRLWNCKKCIKDIEADGTKDKVMHEEHEEERNTTTIAVVENEDANREGSQNDNRRVTRSQKKVHPPSMEASTSVRSKSRKFAKPAQRSKVIKSPKDTGRSREKQNVDQLAATIVAPTEVAVAVTTVAPSEVAVVVEDTLPPEGINPKDSLVLLESDNLSSESISPSTSGLPRRKTRKVRLVKDLLNDKPETGGSKITRKEESSSQMESVQKRKVEQIYVRRPKLHKSCATSENALKSIDADQAERVQEGVCENDANPGESALPTRVESLMKEKDSVPSRLRPKRTARKSVVYNKESSLLRSGSGTDEGNHVTPRAGPSINTSSQPTEDLPSEKRVGTLLDDELASEGYFRKHVPQVNDEPDNDHMRSSDAQANCVTRELGSCSKSNTGGWLTTGVDVVDFSSNNTSSSTKVVDQDSVPQMDASGADRKGKAIMVQDQNENTPKEQNDGILDKEEDVSNKEPQETPQKSKKPLLFDLNEPYVDGTSLEEDDTTRAPETCDTNTARKEDHFMNGQQPKSLDIFPRSWPCRPPPFGIFTPTQENRASSIRFSGHSSQRLGIVPTMGNQLQPSPSSLRLLPACNTVQSVPHQYREAPTRPIWTSPMIPPQCHPNPVPFNMDHSTRRGMLSQAPSNENTRNLNFVGANGNQRCGHGAGVNISRSMGAFSNDISTALNPLVRSNAPAYHHRYTRRQFPPVSQPKVRVQLQAGESSKTPYQPKQLTLDPNNNRFAPESSRKSFPTAPPIGTSSFPFQNAQALWSHQQEINNQRTDAIGPVNSSLARPVFPSSAGQGRSFQLLGSLSSMKLPLNSHLKEKEVKQKRKAESCSNASALPPMNSTSEFGPCNLNRNPADFTIPEPVSVYMLTGKDLRGGKRGPYKKKAGGPVSKSG